MKELEASSNFPSIHFFRDHTFSLSKMRHGIKFTFKNILSSVQLNNKFGSSSAQLSLISYHQKLTPI